MLYSNMPLNHVKYNDLTIDIIMRKVRIPYKSVVLIDEASLLADSLSGSVSRNMTKEAKERFDYINENFTKEFAEEWHYFGADLSRLVNGGTIGFKFVLSTDEIRDIIFDFLYAGSMLKKPFVNWVTGVYDKEAGIFMTQIFGTPPGREVSISMNKYIVLKVGETPFMVTGIVDKSTCEWTCSVPKEYDYLADKLEEGIRMCDYDRMYRMNLPKVDKDYIGEIIDKMKERIAATEGSN